MTTEAPVTTEALWPYALEVYGRPGVEPLMLRLQDAHGQCAAFLLWRLWLAASGRAPDAATLEAGAAMARAWQDAAVAPLRKLRRDLKPPSGPGGESARRRLREGVQALEIDAERMLLQMLEDASPVAEDDGGGAAESLAEALASAVAAWGGDPPAEALAELARLAA
jgi:uncharacterized protein (TIGR02444 family)